jgi:hypothetical protein
MALVATYRLALTLVDPKCMPLSYRIKSRPAVTLAATYHTTVSQTIVCKSYAMTPNLRKFTLTMHLAFSVGWIGAVVAYLVLVVAAMTSQDAQTLRVSWIAMELIGRFAIVPLALASLLTGIIISLGTQWGLFRHYWVLFSLVLTLLATLVLLDHMQTVSFFAGIAAEKESVDVGGLRSGLWGELLHAGAGLLVLLVIQVLNVYKPRGLTPLGWRKQQAERRKQPEQRTTSQRVNSQTQKNELPAFRLTAFVLNLFAKKDNQR